MYNNNITPLSNQNCNITTPGISDGVIRCNDCHPCNMTAMDLKSAFEL